MVCLGIKPGAQDGRHRRNHGAMAVASAHFSYNFFTQTVLLSFCIIFFNQLLDEIRAEHVNLSWDPPADDGGTPITSYLVRYMDIDSGEWVTACTVSTGSNPADC